MPKDRKAEILDFSSRLLTIPDVCALSEMNKRICVEHVRYPQLKKEHIAQKLGITNQEVYTFLHSETWERINNQLACQEMRELLQLAVQSLRECLLSDDPAIKLQAATKVLINGGLLDTGKAAVKNQSNKFVVLWDNEHKNSIHTAPEADGSPLIAGAVQDLRGGQTVGENDVSGQ